MLSVGSIMPSIPLTATDGQKIDMSRLVGVTVIYAYPRTSSPDGVSLDGWDLIPGARGCTPQACAFRDHYADLKQVGCHHLFGLSTQETDYQIEAATRLHLPFPLLSDYQLQLTQALGLPTFETGGMCLLERLTLILKDGVIIHIMSPVIDPSKNAEEVLSYLRHISE